MQFRSRSTWTRTSRATSAESSRSAASEAAAELTFLGLYALQHRGQESAGIVAIDDEGVARSHKGMGQVNEAFDDATMRRLPGTVAIGHVRYSTSGSSSLRNAQPVLVNYRHGPMALAHNGTLTNAKEIGDRLTEEGAIFQTESDSEVVIHLIARSRRDLPDQQVDDALSQVVGAFSLVLCVGRTIYVASDPRGFGRSCSDGWETPRSWHSETCALDIIGAEYERDVRPGEVLRIDDGVVTPLRPLEPATASPCLFELVYFARPDSRIWGCSVDRARRAFGRQLARRAPRRSRLRLFGSRLLQFRRPGLRRNFGPPVRARVDSEPLRRAGPSSIRPRRAVISGFASSTTRSPS